MDERRARLHPAARPPRQRVPHRVMRFKVGGSRYSSPQAHGYPVNSSGERAPSVREVTQPQATPSGAASRRVCGMARREPSARRGGPPRPPARPRARRRGRPAPRSEEHTSELQSRENLVCRLLLEKKKIDTPLLTYIIQITSQRAR